MSEPYKNPGRIGAVAIIILAAGAGLFVWVWYQTIRDDIAPSPVMTFAECLDSDHAVVMESHPRQCRTADGILFVEELEDEQEAGVNEDEEQGHYISRLGDLLVVSEPRANSEVSSPLSVHGQVLISWVFEGDFPVELQDSNGQVISRSYGRIGDQQAGSDHAAFTAVLEFEPQPSGSEGSIVLRKDNPEGDPAFDDEVRLPIKFPSN